MSTQPDLFSLPPAPFLENSLQQARLREERLWRELHSTMDETVEACAGAEAFITGDLEDLEYFLAAHCPHAHRYRDHAGFLRSLLNRVVGTDYATPGEIHALRLLAAALTEYGRALRLLQLAESQTLQTA